MGAVCAASAAEGYPAMDDDLIPAVSRLLTLSITAGFSATATSSRSSWVVDVSFIVCDGTGTPLLVKE
jgi:hypothetical protein